MQTISNIVIVDRVLGIIAPAHGRLILTPGQFIASDYPKHARITARTRIINLCNAYGYLKTGYYCSLLADARQMRCVPSISEIIHANWKRLHAERFAELERELNDPETRAALGDSDAINIYFGRADHPHLQNFTRKAFNDFRLPSMTIRFATKAGQLRIKNVEPLPLRRLEGDAERFNAALDQYSGAQWVKPKGNKKAHKYWLAILHDPKEVNAPSNTGALKKFIRIGAKMDFYVEMITKANFDSLLEFDALFIRETTSVNGHTYKFAEKAEREGLAVIDDPVSILRCCNKVFLQDMLPKNGLTMPGCQLLYRRDNKLPELDANAFPKVLKVPDGSFSLGVFKVTNMEELNAKSKELFKSSEIILMQDFVKSDFDWRIVTLGGKAIFACKYFMAKQHWQIYNHSAKGKNYGNVECVPVPEVPPKILAAATKASSLIGSGLYGVDLKEIDGQAVIIEINDNPNIDSGFEDQLLGDDLYRAVFDHFRDMIDG